MTALGLLHGVHGEKADAIGHIPQMLIAGFGNRLDGRVGGSFSHDCWFLLRWIDRWGKVWRRFRASRDRNSKPESSDSFRCNINIRQVVICWIFAAMFFRPRELAGRMAR